ncbi:MAG: HAD family hydrolase [Planctomycetota bacterium]
MTSCIEALFIDYYGTICGGDRNAVLGTSSIIVNDLCLTMNAEDFARYWGDIFFATIAASNHDDFRTLHQCEIDSLLQAVSGLDDDLEFDPNPYIDQLDEYWRNPPLHDEVMTFLKRVNVPVCCVSNADTEPLLEAIETQGLRFDAVITSEQTRSYKPDAHIFRTAIQHMRVQPERCFHVGDSLHSDIAGAAGVGLRTGWICRDVRIHDIGCEKPDLQVANLLELPF